MLNTDLHMHSVYSLDGEIDPGTLVELCKKAELTTISITDHNLVTGVSEALAFGARAGIRVIPGIEIDCQFRGIDLHVLGYHINWTDDDFGILEESIRDRILERFPVMIDKLSGAGIEVSLDEVLQKAGGNLPSGELIAEVLLGNPRYRGNKKLDAYRTGGPRSDMPYINFYLDFFAQGKPAYVKIDYMEYGEAIDLIRRNQGVPVVAHPGLNLKGREEVVEELLDHGAAGLEVFNNYHTEEQIFYFAEVAEARKVLMTCGSDFHGKTKPLIRPGSFRRVRKFEGYVEESVNTLRLRSG
jgi:predicted metal-dependent phosphoesterase TrpH